MRTVGIRLVLAAACPLLLVGATCQGTGPTPLDQSRQELSELSPEARQVVAGALERLKTFAGCGHTVRECLAAHPGCAHARRELSLLAALARSGATADEAVAEAEAYYARFAAPAAAVDLSQAACKGDAGASVTVVVFSDFECPACSAVRSVVDGLTADPRVRLCFRHFPLDVHPSSRPAAQAAEVARAQGRFWELHDQLFDHQAELSVDQIVAHAAAVGVDAAAVRQALAEGRYLDLVNGSKADGKALGVTGTPTLFFNGRTYPLPIDGPFLKLAVEDHAEFARGGWTRD